MEIKMKNLIYMMAGVAMAAAVSSCVDTEKPVYTEPTTFTVNRPPLQDQYLATTGDIDDKTTFNLTCSGQPDYGFAAQANYNAQVSLTGEFKDEVRDENDNVVTPATYSTLSNQDQTSSSMSLRTYDLAVAMCSLLGIEDEDSWKDYLAAGGATTGITVYFRGTCEIPGVPSSFIASSNTVTYTDVTLSYAVPTAGIIYICGDVNGFTEPSAANAEFYRDYQLVEPEIGSKIYAGVFTMPDTESVHPGAEGVDYTTQFRFFTELSGWGDGSKMIGSNEADFYVEDVTNSFTDGSANGSMFTGNATYGKGNWGILLEEPAVMTIAVSIVDKNKPKVWFRFGNWNVTVGKDASGINEPVFSEPAE